ncbi:hypothetical protein F8568_002840 [Actinomadura sp. LD22]|uniref:Protein kinase domain-containing protein n=1 Tax=Actinomadura physcomitrii TaxID=2650748 RepID=A0A6I4M1Y0_9ACTN|nr:hypothetical protein [Actinomadura physcomitrii]MVZ99341.1 hypothetical protein [Actinomadura physcomitrii]
MSGETSHQEHIGPYRLLSPPAGGTGVHRATGPDGRDVAIRLLPPGAAPDIERMRAVLSPYAADVLDGETGVRRPYVVSRFVPGRPLAEVVAEQGPLPGDALRRMAAGLAKALAAVHRAGLAHGELGPGTVLVVDGAPVVVDFGLVAGAHRPGDVHAWAATVAFAATGRYAAPPDALPADLRPLVAAAADPDPAARPDAERLAEEASRLVVRPARPVPAPAPAVEAAAPRPVAPAPAEPAASPGGPAVAQAWARLLAATVVVIGVGVAVMMPIAGLLLTLAAVTVLRAAMSDTVAGWAWALGRTALTVPYAAALTVAVPLGLAAASVLGGEIDSLGACAFGAGAGAAVLWTAPGVSAPRRQLERMFTAVAGSPRRIAVAGAALGALALLAVVGAMSLTPSFAPMYGLQSTLERSMDRLQNAMDRW